MVSSSRRRGFPERFFTCAFLLSSVFFDLISSNVWIQSDYPNPEMDPAACGRTAASRVCDPDRVFAKNQVDRLDSMISGLEKIDVCSCGDENLCKLDNNRTSFGHPLKVALAYNISVTKSLQEDGQEFADYLRSKWTLGSCDNLVVILLIEVHHRVFVSSGKVAISHDELQELGNHLKNSYDNFEDFELLIKKITAIIHQSSDSKGNFAKLPQWGIGLIAAAAILMVFLCIFMICKKCRVKAAPSSEGLPWPDTKVKVYNLGFRKKSRPRQVPQKY